RSMRSVASMIADTHPLTSRPTRDAPAVPALPTASPVMSERRVVLIGAALVLVGSVSMAMYTPAMPEIVRALETNGAMAQLTLTAYFAGFAIMQLVCGPLSDGLGRRPVTLAFVGIYVLA